MQIVSKRDATVFLLGVICGCIVVGLGMLAIRNRLAIYVVTQDSEISQSPRGEPSHSGIKRLSYGLNGYCPVTLYEEWQWKLGNIQYGETRDDQVFLFAGAAEREQFRRDPDRYLPAFSGNDVVVALEGGDTTRGKREHGLKYDDQIYLFSSEESLQRFVRDPKLYLTPTGDGQMDSDAKVAINSGG